MAFAFEPTVVASKNGRHSLALAEFEGVHRMANRDAVGFYFTVKAPTWSDNSRIAVLFSGTSLMSDPKYFGLPDYGDRDANFVQFALAAVGDYLDEIGPPPLTPSGTAAAQIDAFSGRFQEWKRRSASPDDDVLTYLAARQYWTWKYRQPRTLFSSHDLLRLGIEVADLHRLAQLEEGHLWQTHSKSAYGISLEPSSELLRTMKAELEPTPETKPSPPEPKAASPTIDKNTMQDSPESEETPPPVPKRKRRSPTKRRRGKGGDATALVFVDDARLADLRQISTPMFDLRKLIAVCDELNVCYRSQCHLAVAALTRTVLDHVPPIFGVDTFAKVANNYAGGKSFKASMAHLELSARNIADGHLHGQIRPKESLPTRTQVNFAADVDVLLAEIIRILA